MLCFWFLFVRLIIRQLFTAAYADVLVASKTILVKNLAIFSVDVDRELTHINSHIRYLLYFVGWVTMPNIIALRSNCIWVYARIHTPFIVYGNQRLDKILGHLLPAWDGA